MLRRIGRGNFLTKVKATRIWFGYTFSEVVNVDHLQRLASYVFANGTNVGLWHGPIASIMLKEAAQWHA
jgi:hypothetical protein